MKAYNRRRRESFEKRALRGSLLAALALFAAAAILLASAQRISLWRASRLADAGEYEAALRLIDELDPDRLGEAAVAGGRYHVADVEYARGEYDGAVELFRALGDFQDSAERVNACNYARAGLLAEAGYAVEAARMYFLLGDYLDAAQRYEDCRAQGGEAASGGGALAGTVDDVGLAWIEYLRGVREALPSGRLAAGARHTVGLRADGSVCAAGSNEYGQCEVASWTGVTAVAAGARHTLGLLADGTLLAAGSNEYGQCEVASWTDVVAVAAGDYDTVALRADGTVLACGYHDYAELTALRGVTRVSAGAYAAACLYGEDGLSVTHPSMALGATGTLADVSLTTACCVGLGAGGGVTTSGPDLSSWRNIVAVDAGGTAILGLDDQGAVYGCFFRASDVVDLRFDARVKAVAAGGAHCAFLLEDGRVVARGDDAFGQCQTGEWRLEGT